MADLLEDDGVAEPVASPKKRSIFSKAAKQRLSEADEAVEFFSRAKEIYPQRLEEEERRRQKRVVKLERKRSSTSADHKESTPPGGKKRRVSSQRDARDGYSSDSAGERDGDEERSWNRRASIQSTPSSQPRKSQSSPSQHKSHTSPKSLSARYNKDLQTQKRQIPKKDKAPKGYISLTDSSDNEGERTTLPVKKPSNQPITLDDDDDWNALAPQRAPSPVIEDGLQFSDEEFPELIQQARERERQKLQQKLNIAKAFGEQNHGAKGTPSDVLDDIFNSEPRATIASDPTIEILITSKLEGTVPLKVRRKLSQRLKEVRLSWCDKQSINGQAWDPQTKNMIYLTWKKIRLFDATTCTALGLQIDGQGKLSGNGLDGIDPEERIHMEAWTEEAFQIYQKRKVAKQKREQGESDGEAAVPEEKENAVQKIKLIMRARSMGDYKIMVKATTTIGKMIGAFRQGRGVPDEKRIAVHLEGDELDPATTIGELDLEDMDIVEVHIR